MNHLNIVTDQSGYSSPLFRTISTSFRTKAAPRRRFFEPSHLVEMGAKPESILLLTFTRRAASSMLTRAAALADRHGPKRLLVATGSLQLAQKLFLACAAGVSIKPGVKRGFASGTPG